MFIGYNLNLLSQIKQKQVVKCNNIFDDNCLLISFRVQKYLINSNWLENNQKKNQSMIIINDKTRKIVVCRLLTWFVTENYHRLVNF